MAKPKVAFYWCSSCGGCEEAVVDLNEDILKVVEAVDIVFWPVALDFKYSDVEKMADGEIAVSFINGAIRMDEQEEISQLLRKKSQTVIAFGSCSHMGGIPGLANFSDRQALLDRVYLEIPGKANPDKVIPREKSTVDGHELTLPRFWDNVKMLNEIVDVDYYLPGCPPQPDTIRDALAAILKGTLPPKGAVLSPSKNLCFDCPRRQTKPEMLCIDQVRRIHEVQVGPNECFLAKGVICLGPATRSGCGEKCIKANMPCRGCYGPCDGVTDQGAAFLSAFASNIDATDEKAIEEVFRTFDDIAGTVYRFSLPASLAEKGVLRK
ncbi:MAG: oxidoreductase [Phycisphaerae bacterium]|nr:oxidoreductase [Phycisphaerae bacterium]